MASAAPVSSASNDDDKRASEKTKTFNVDERRSFELVIAFSGPVGSGVSTVCAMLAGILEQDFGYNPQYIKVSDIIKEHAHEVSVDLDRNFGASERIDNYQNAGNRLREKKSSYLADRVIEQINIIRRREGGVLDQTDAPDIAIPAKIVYLIDSLKNPEEVRRLKQIYGDLFWHISVFAPDSVREKRLTDSNIEETVVRHIMKRDEQEGPKTGQQVSKTAHLADYFIRNHSDVVDNVKPAIERFLDTIFGTKLYTPTIDESGMMKAASAAVRSACMSRQVGAAIYSSFGELIGVGCNDVPKSGGGLYSSDLPESEDKRCYKWAGKICHNDDRKKKLADSIAKSIITEGDRSSVLSKVSQSEAKNLIEFSRSVHAEMEAIVSVARMGRGSTIGSTLYTTTFPCHNCARHIVAAGVSKVVFIEPYSKSLALKLHYDAITLTDERDKVHFVQYEGFSPTSSLRVFSSVGRERKEHGKFIDKGRRDATPLFLHPLDSYMTSEELVIQELVKLQEGQNG